MEVRVKFRVMTLADAKKIALAYLQQTSFYGLFNRKDIFHEAYEGQILNLHEITRDWGSSRDWEMVCLAHRSACKAQEIIFGDADCPHPKEICFNCICQRNVVIK